MNRIRVTDSHTAGEPTRIVLEGGPDLGTGPLVERVKMFREKHDAFRSAVCNEPRGSEALVGGLLVPATNPKAAAAVIFSSNDLMGVAIQEMQHLGKVNRLLVALGVSPNMVREAFPYEPGDLPVSVQPGTAYATLACQVRVLRSAPQRRRCEQSQERRGTRLLRTACAKSRFQHQAELRRQLIHKRD